MNKIYFDNAATTRVRDEVFAEMNKYFTESYGNPSGIYETGRDNRAAIDLARERVSVSIGAKSNEVFFTASGTESNNWAIKGVASAYKSKGNHIITTAIEHHAVLHTCEYMEQNGCEVTYLPVNRDGLIDLDELKAAIKPETILISVMFANNEIGTIQPIKEIGAIAREAGVLFHTDAVQAVGAVPIDVKELNIDLLSMSAHKLYGPKGIGALYIKSGIKVTPLIHGGSQERRQRAGTENVAGIVGFGLAAHLAVNEMTEKNKHITALRNRVIEGISEAIPNSWVNGSLEHRLPNNANFSFEFIEGEAMLLLLDMKGIAASSGSACTSGSLDPSHVLLSLGLLHEEAHGSLRVSIGMYNTEEEVEYLIEELPKIVQRLREMSPLYKG